MIRYEDSSRRVIHYTYDDHGNCTSIRYPSLRKKAPEKTVTYTYDAAGNIKSVTDWNGKDYRYTYDLRGRQIQLIRPNRSIEGRDYDAADRLIQIEDQSAGGSLLLRQQIRYDRSGNITEKTTEGMPSTPSLPQDEEIFLTHAFGMLYTADREIVRFDADGNITRFHDGNKRQDLQYDAHNRLIKIGKITYTYDSEGRRIEQRGRKHRQTYLTDVLHENLLVISDRKKQETCYLYGNGLLMQEDSSGIAYYHYDAQGNTLLMTGEDSEELGSYRYDPHGNRLTHTGKDTIFGYSGKYGVATDESGLLYMRSRYYSPALHQFLSADSYMGDLYHPLSLNPYSYVEGNPVRYIDPMGYWATEFATYEGHHPVQTTQKKLPLPKNKNVQKQPSLLSQSLYDISVDCTEGTDPFRQSVRYQQFSRQAEKLGLYGSYREEYIRFLRIAYGSLEYGRTDGLSGISYTDAELREMYGFDESPGRFHEKMLYQQGYEMGRAEREAWGMVAIISIMKEGQAINPKESKGVDESSSDKFEGSHNVNIKVQKDGFGKLAGRQINITEKGLDIVKKHLSKFGDVPENQHMINRLENALKNGQPLKDADASFYLHEIHEFTLMEKGLSYEEAHIAALQKYQVSEYSVYSLETVLEYPEMFNLKWLEFWERKQ